MSMHALSATVKRSTSLPGVPDAIFKMCPLLSQTMSCVVGIGVLETSVTYALVVTFVDEYENEFTFPANAETEMRSDASQAKIMIRS